MANQTKAQDAYPHTQRKIVDHRAFERACGLLLIDIPRHVNECFSCRRGQSAVHAALDGKPAAEVDHAAFQAATELFCATGQAQTTEYGEMVRQAFGLTVDYEASRG